MSKPLTIALTIAFLAVTAALTPLPLTFRDFEPSDTLRTLTALFTISLVLERALEVFVSTWRTPDMRVICLASKRARKRMKEAQASGDAAEIKAATESLRRRETAEQEYRTGTHIFALRLGFILGILVSTVGIRTFEGLLAPGALSAATQAQSIAFRAVDVLMTGGVIAGGSEAIHKLIQLFTARSWRRRRGG
ncbi:MAG: hypothetical protein R3B09_06330 [Nannocystaceae bacterium]